MYLLFRTYTPWCQFVLKKSDVTESRYGQNILSRSSSRRLEQVDDQGLRDGKGVHTIRDSCYHRETGVGWQQTCHDKSSASKIYTTWACILSDRNIFCTPRVGRTTAGLMPLGLFLFVNNTILLHISHMSTVAISGDE